MKPIFTPTDLREMQIAADFRWLLPNTSLTVGITPHLIPTLHCEDLDKVIDKMLERR